MRWLLLMVAIGCASTHADTETPDAMPPSIGEVVDAYATSTCARYVRCEWTDVVPGAGGHGISREQCEVDLRVYLCDYMDCSALYGGDWSKLQSCLDVYEHAECDVAPMRCDPAH